MNTRRAILATLTLGAAAALTGCGVGQASVTDEETIRAATPVPVEVAQPFRSNINATYSVTATIASDFDAPVVARVAGEVIELLVEEGDRVAQGQVLARLDGERLRLEMLAAKANLERARTEFQRNADLAERGLISASMRRMSSGSSNTSTRKSGRRSRASLPHGRSSRGRRFRSMMKRSALRTHRS
jgi:multidrug efflux pump subunit AcrA (membrane-fusion protein)